jgi:cobalt/nickel transport system permease protein
MSHIHIPDGILTSWLWIIGYIILGIYLFVFSRYLKNGNNTKKITLVSVMVALMLLTMSVPIPLMIPYHINLSVLSGILLGPFWASIAVFIVNIILSFLGHGGITIIGLNTLVVSTEAIVGYFLFKTLKRYFRNIYKPALLSTLLALMIGTSLTIGIVYIGTKNISFLAHHHEETQNHHDNDEDNSPISIKKFLTLVLLAGSIGWTIESILTAFIIEYIRKVNPKLLSGENFENN